MLDTFRMEWLTNPDLANIQRDLGASDDTTSGNTGTGGIAYLDVVCFGAVRRQDSARTSTPGTTYDLTNYSWNSERCRTRVRATTLGPITRIGAAGQAGRLTIATKQKGRCTNEPQAQVGTMMSYCHAVVRRFGEPRISTLP